MSNIDEKITKSIDSMLDNAILNQDTSTELGISQEYNAENRAKLWDSAKGKAEFKESAFGDKKSMVDPITGELLHKSQTAAKKKYHSESSSAWAKHSAETDHVDAIKDVHNVAKHNPFLTDQDLHDVVNSESNYRLLPKSTNASKGEKNDWEIILDPNSGIDAEGKKVMAAQKIRADVSMHADFAIRTAKSASGEFVKGAKTLLIDSAIPLTAEAVHNLCQVAHGDKSLSQASKDMSKAAIDVAVRGGANQLLSDIFGKNEWAQITRVSLIVKDAAVKYINGEISETEFINEIGEKGEEMVVTMIAGSVGREIGIWLGTAIGAVGGPIGMIAGAVIGEVLGTIITTIACSAIVTARDVLKHMDDYKLKEAEISRLTNYALHEIENQRNKLKCIANIENTQWNKNVEESFNMMSSSILNSSDSEEQFIGITRGLDKLLSMFNSSAMFHSIDEFDSQLDKPLNI